VLDFPYLPRLPIDKTDAYRNLEQAIRCLEARIQALTFAQAQTDDGLADRLIAFWSALSAAQLALGESESMGLPDTIQELRVYREPEAEFAATVLTCGARALFPKLRDKALIERVRKLVRDVLDSLHHFGESNRKWHHVKNRIAEYAEALLDALRPAGLADRVTPPQKLEPRWDGMRLWYGERELRSYQKRAAPRQAPILEALEKAHWPDRPVQLPESCWADLHITLKRINEKIKDCLLELHAGGDGHSVFWSKNEEV
jgi:hypothetical protein